MTGLRTGSVTVSVPASSANLGPGFDSLGLALELRDRVTASVREGGAHVSVEGVASREVPLDEGHLVYRSALSAFAEMGFEVPGIKLVCENQIPHGRGLGSSSAAIVAGICAARGLVSGGVDLLDDARAFQLAARLEGHPDNVAPALFGGFTIASARGDAFVVAKARVDPRVCAVLYVPGDRVETKHARSVLPENVTHAAAVANAGRVALLVAALTDYPDLLLAATEDRLHQDYREPLMPATLRLVRALRADAVPAVLSGSGPSVLAFSDQSGREELASRAPSGWRALALDISREGAVATVGDQAPE